MFWEKKIICVFLEIKRILWPIYSQYCRKRNWSSQRVSQFLKVTQLISGRRGTWTQAFWFGPLHLFNLVWPSMHMQLTDMPLHQWDPTENIQLLARYFLIGVINLTVKKKNISSSLQEVSSEFKNMRSILWKRADPKAFSLSSPELVEIPSRVWGTASLTL